MKHYYQLSWRVWLSTGIAYVALLALLVYTLYTPEYRILAPFVLVIIALMSITVLWRPVYYEWQPDGLHVRLLAFNKFYPYAQYEIEEDGTLLRRIRFRLFGSGGFFGYLGFFWIVERGICLCYVAHESQPVLFIHKQGSKRGVFINGVKPEQQA